jgi:hypothetical protein
MSDYIRHLRDIQRAKVEERLTRTAAERTMKELAEFATLTATCVGRDDGLNDAVNVEELDEIVARARAAAVEHAAAYARLAELQR